jgi:hypothetical protein
VAVPEALAPAGSARQLRTDGNGLEVLDEATSFALLSSAVIGRVGYISGGIALVAPVNITVQRTVVYFQVGPGGLLAAITDGQLLTLEADAVDAHTRAGWSVIVTGQGHEMPRRPDPPLPPVTSWLRSRAARVVRIIPLEISGRRLNASLMPHASQIHDAGHPAPVTKPTHQKKGIGYGRIT